MEETTPAVKKPGFIRRNIKTIIFIGMFASLGFGGNYYINKSTEKAPIVTTSIVDTLTTTKETDDGTGPVAKVNGVEISRVDYQNTVKELTLTLLKQGYTTTDSTVISQIRQQSVAILVNTELLVQDAKAKGVEISDAEVYAKYQEILTDMGSEEVLALTLKDMKLTETDLREDIRNQLAVDRHIETATKINDVTVADEEVRAYYDNVSINNADIPSFDNIKAELKEQLLQQKKQQVVSDFIQNLRENAQIENLI
jgi:hypothetical protein